MVPLVIGGDEPRPVHCKATGETDNVDLTTETTQSPFFLAPFLIDGDEPRPVYTTTYKTDNVDLTT